MSVHDSDAVIPYIHLLCMSTQSFLCWRMPEQEPEPAMNKLVK